MRLVANNVMGMRRRRESALRRHTPRNHPRYVSKRRLKRAAKEFDRRVTSFQRVALRLGNAKRPDGLTVEIDKAKSLRNINSNLEALLDVMRFAVGCPRWHIRAVYV